VRAKWPQFRRRHFLFYRTLDEFSYRSQAQRLTLVDGHDHLRVARSLWQKKRFNQSKKL
jgi:hypothetical protein